MQHLMHHVTVSLQQSKITLQNNCINNTSITQPTLSFYLWLKMQNLQLSRKLLWLEPYCSTPEVHQTSSKAGSWINILYLLTGPIEPTGRIFIDRVAGAIRVSVRLWALSCLNRLTFDRDFWREGRPWPWLACGCRSRSNSENCLCSPVWTSGAEQVDIRTRLAEFSQW